MSILLHGDCITEMAGIDDDSVDLIYTDLPYATKSFGKCTDCEWDKPVDLDKMWIELMRIKKLHTPLFFSCNVKLGYDLIRTCPKKCPFRYDLIWCKSAKSGFLLSKKQPLRAHEFVYVFYERQPFYDVSSHKHKFLDTKNGMKGQDELIYGKSVKQVQNKKYDPPLPTAIINMDCKVVKRTDGGCEGTIYGKESNKVFIYDKDGKLRNSEPRYDPPLPTAIINMEDAKIIKGVNNTYNTEGRKVPLKRLCSDVKYDPPLPSSTINKGVPQEPEPEPEPCKYPGNPVMREDTTYGNIVSYEIPARKNGESRYEPPLPDSLLEVRSERGKHQTQKPVGLMSWILKYYSKPGDVVFDCCMGSGSMGVACKNMERQFIGIELNPEIYEMAVNRVEG